MEMKMPLNWRHVASNVNNIQFMIPKNQKNKITQWYGME